MIVFDHTQIQTYKNCPSRYYKRFIKGLQKLQYDERDIDKDFGKCIHKALAILYTEKDLNKAKEYFKVNFQGLEGNKVKTPLNGLQLLDWYHNYYSTPRNELSDTNMETLGVEVKDIVRLSDDVEYMVKIDRIVKNNAGIWVMETKTTTKIPNNFFYQFDPNSQLSGYCLYVRNKYGQCSGAIVNAICVGYRERGYKGEPAGFWCKFVREIINRNVEQLNDFIENTLIWANKLKQAIETDCFPKNEDYCHNFRGCQYKELCITCNDEEIENTLYRKMENPLDYLDLNAER